MPGSWASRCSACSASSWPSGPLQFLQTPDKAVVVPLAVGLTGEPSAIIWVHQRRLDVIPEPVRHADGGADDPAEPRRGCDGQ